MSKQRRSILSVLAAVAFVIALCPAVALATADEDFAAASSPITHDADSRVDMMEGGSGAIGDLLQQQDVAIIASGECGAEGDNVIWTLDSEGTLTVSGTGEMADGRVAADYASQVKAIVIEEGVLSVGNSAFQSMQLAASVSFPEGLKKIGTSAFWSCGSIARIELPDNLEELGASAFAQCSNLQSITFPDSLDVVPGGVCSSCTKLSSVRFPANAKSIGNNAFYFDTSLRRVSFPDGLETIGDGAFRSCPLSMTSFPDTLDSIGSNAFYGNNMSSITVPGSVKVIGYCAFYRSWSASSVVLSEGVERIGAQAFAGSKMASIAYPSTLTNVGERPFEDCSNLSVVTIAEGNDAYVMKGAGLYTKDGATLIACLPNAQGAFSIAEGTQTVSAGCFATCTHITSISIPASLEAGNDTSLLICGETTFSGWKSLTSYEVAEENEAYKAVDGVLFNKTGDVLVGFPAGRVNGANSQDGSVCSEPIWTISR